MTRLIDADALNLEYEVDMADDWKTAHEIANIVKYAPTVDAVPVIRCKDCKWYEFDVSHRCGYTGLNGYIAEDDFCSKAEPKETEE